MQYEFDFSKMTVGDNVNLEIAAQTNNHLLFFATVNKAMNGGLLELPLSELASALRQFNTGYTEYAREMLTPVTMETADGERLLRQALGGE